MDSLLQGLILAVAGGWLGYAFAGRRWRQAERRVVYREYLLSAHNMFEEYFRFRDQWDRAPETMPEQGWHDLRSLMDEVRLKAQDVRLIAPLKLCERADAVWVSLQELMTELIPNSSTGNYDRASPPTYRWFKDRRDRFYWGPNLDDLDEFVNMARADLGAQSRLWRIRGESTSYRRALRDWLRHEAAGHLPLIGRRIRAQQLAKWEQSEREAQKIPLRDPYTGQVIPAPDGDGS